METKIARICNKAGEGEAEHPVLQVLENLQTIEFSEIKFVNENTDVRSVSLVNSILDQPEILHILNVLKHEVAVSFDENNDVTLHF